MSRSLNASEEPSRPRRRPAAHGRRRPRPDLSAQTPPAPATSPAAVPAVDPAKVVARVNGADITEGDLAIAAEDPALQMPNVPEEQKRDLLTGYLIDLKLGAKAAEAAKVGERRRVRPQARL